MADPTLPTLVRLARTKPAIRALCCPVCSGEITLADHVLSCALGHSFAKLAELTVKQ